jgi:hypothetical protein
MIAKGSSRSGPKQLAVYLMRVGRYDTGEPTELLELQSPWAAAPNGTRERTAANLAEAFRDWQTLCEGTKQGEYGLYHAQISPAPKYAQNMTPEQWKRAADLLGEELGLQDQPRALVLHAGKDGRNHLHVVWSRTDIDVMKLHSDSHNYQAHERASHRMELEFGQEFVPGKHAKRDREQQPEFPREKMNQDEAQQVERLGMTKAERIAQIAAIRKPCDDGLAFKNALEEAGYVLAKGDRGIILVDQQGEIFSLTKYLPDLKGKPYKAFMASVDQATLPTVEEARATQDQRQATVKPEAPAEAEKQAPEASKFLPPDLAQQLEPAAPAPADAQKQAEASKFLQPVQAPEKAPEVPAPQSPAPEKLAPPPEDPELTALKKALAERHAKEVQKWVDYNALELQRLEYDLTHLNADKAKDFAALQAVAMNALKDRLKQERTGLKGALNAIQSKLNPTLAAEKAKERRREIGQLKARQEKELEDYLALIEQTKELEIENLKERQALQSSDRERQHEEEQETNIRDHHEAQRLLAELEAKRIHEKLEKDNDLRDGPPPPRRGK